jgi:hypothetical protein
MLCSYFPQEKLTVIKHEEMKMTPETLKLVEYKVICGSILMKLISLN